jgi:monomeric isocitrate dehydrogenase
MSVTPHVKSHYREATNKYGQIIQVPVVDVRDGIAERMVAMQMIKASNRSKYIVYNEYHRSHKPKTQI